MKKIMICLCMLFFYLTSLPQSTFLSYPTENGKIHFKDVVSSNDDAGSLFRNAHKFIQNQEFYGPCKVVAKNGRQLNQPIIFRSSDVVDSTAGKVGGKAFYIVNYGTDNFFTLNFDYEIRVKDKMYKYDLTNFFIYEYRSIPKYATQTNIQNTPFEKIVKDGSVDVYTLEDFRTKIQFPATTNQTVMADIEKFVNSLKETMSGVAPVKWE